MTQFTAQTIHCALLATWYNPKPMYIVTVPGEVLVSSLNPFVFWLLSSLAKQVSIFAAVEGLRLPQKEMVTYSTTALLNNYSLESHLLPGSAALAGAQGRVEEDRLGCKGWMWRELSHIPFGGQLGMPTA